MLHTATDRATLRKVEDCSTFPATRLAIFVARQVAKRGCYTLRCKLQEKLPRVTAPLAAIPL